MQYAAVCQNQIPYPYPHYLFWEHCGFAVPVQNPTDAQAIIHSFKTKIAEYTELKAVILSSSHSSQKKIAQIHTT
jgi:hypothetical protein